MDFFTIIVSLIILALIWNCIEGVYLDKTIFSKDKICKCGSKMIVENTSHVYTKFGRCLSCNRAVDFACDYQLYTPKKTRLEELWTEPKVHFKCEKCGSDFFASKILSGNVVKWLKCIKCGQEKDLRE